MFPFINEGVGLNGKLEVTLRSTMASTGIHFPPLFREGILKSMYSVVIICMHSLLFLRYFVESLPLQDKSLCQAYGDEGCRQSKVKQCFGLHGRSFWAKYLNLECHQQDLIIWHGLLHIGCYIIQRIPRVRAHLVCLTILALGISVQPQLVWLVTLLASLARQTLLDKVSFA